MTGHVKAINTWLSNGRPDVLSADATVALGIVNNAGAAYGTSGRYTKGIVFDAHAIRGTDGVAGHGVAIALAKGHVEQWYANGQRTSGIVGDVSDPARATFLAFGDLGLAVTQGDVGPPLLLVPPVAQAVSYPSLSAAASGAVSLSAAGARADLTLLPANGFVLVLGGASAGSATPGSAAALPGAPAKYKLIRDAENGKLYKVPLYNP